MRQPQLAPCWRTHQIKNDGQGQCTVKYKRDERAEQRAIGRKRFSHAHHEHDIDPRDRHQQHAGIVPFLTP
jgi:hypothetical protein